MIPFCDAWDEQGYPRELHREARAQAQPRRALFSAERKGLRLPLALLLKQLYAAGIGGAIFPPEYGGTPPDGCATHRCAGFASMLTCVDRPSSPLALAQL